MPLYLADVHLHRARLGGMMDQEGKKLFPTVDAKAEMEKARVLIEKHHYYRRREELADATRFLKQFNSDGMPLEKAVAALCQTLFASAEFRCLY